MRRIERELVLRSKANLDSTETRILPAGGSLAAPSGLTLVQGIEEVQVKWNALDVGNLKHYEVQLDTDNTFPDPTIFKPATPNYNFVGLDAATEYFVRVRGILTSGDDGAFSGTLSTTTAQVVEADIADEAVTTDKLATNAVTKITTATQSGTLALLDGVFQTVVTVTVTKDEGTSSDLVIWFGMDLEQYISGLSNAEGRIQITRDSVSQLILGDGSKGIHVHNDRETIVSFAIVQTGLAAGSYVYDIDALELGAPDIDAVDGFIIVEELKA